MPCDFVIKADGSEQAFQKEKVIKTCLRVGVTAAEANQIANKVEERCYDGIPTKEILEMLFDEYLKPYKPIIAFRNNLRKSISLLRSKPDFEFFIQKLLEEIGYTVTPNCICQGKCVEHEIDAVAKNNEDTILVEIKHHKNEHTMTDLEVCRGMWAKFEDLQEGFQEGVHPFPFSKAMIITNTKFSKHALKYSRCRNIDHINWYELEKLIEERKFYPITLLKGPNKKERDKLIDEKIITLRQLIESDAEQVAKKLNHKQEIIDDWISKSKEILSD
ncbi:MAG: restriction endonuclease [Promethearchaeota archaeon]